jgi:hypothetical protein
MYLSFAAIHHYNIWKFADFGVCITAREYFLHGGVIIGAFNRLQPELTISISFSTVADLRVRRKKESGLHQQNYVISS